MSVETFTHLDVWGNECYYLRITTEIGTEIIQLNIREYNKLTTILNSK